MNNNKLNILLTVPRLNIGGAESYVGTVAARLQERGHNVHVASWGGHLATELSRQGIHHFLVPIRLHAGLAAFMLERIIKRQRIDLVHANSAAAGLAAVKACRKLDVPCVYTAHGVLGHDVREQALAQADTIICVSDFLRCLSIERGFPQERLITLYNGVDTDKFKPNQAVGEQSRADLGISPDEFVIGIISRIRNIHDKGHADLLAMLHQYAARRKWKLLVVGKGSGMAELKREVNRLGLEDKVCFAGFRQEVQQVLAAMDVVALPSNFETFGLVLAEANAAGKPVIAYAVGGVPEAIDDGETGFLVPKKDLATLYEKLSRLDEDKDLSRRMGAAGRQRVKQQFNDKTMVDNLLQVYDKVLQQHRRKHKESGYVSASADLNVPQSGKSIT